MTSEPEVRQFQLSDEPALLSFLRLAYPDDLRKSDPPFWRWHYLENPYADLNNTPLWIVKSGDQIVGQLATIPVRLTMSEKSLGAIWILDFIVRGDYRGKGLGKRLVQAASNYSPVMITLGINEQSKAVFRSLNWKELGRIHRYQKLLYAGNAIDASANIAPARAVANLCSTPFRMNLHRIAANKEYEVRTVQELDPSFDALWKKASSHWTCAVERNAAYLDWQFRRQPNKKFDVIGLYRKNELVGYAVLFFRKPRHGTASPKAAISDVCFDSKHAPEAIDRLIEAALIFAVERRAGSLVTDVLEPCVEERLQQYGFRQVKNSPEFMAWTTAGDASLIYEPKNWFLTRADSDVSIFERPNT
jgi:GNAT superfamily N-acetyltransferase